MKLDGAGLVLALDATAAHPRLAPLGGKARFDRVGEVLELEFGLAWSLPNES